MNNKFEVKSLYNNVNPKIVKLYENEVNVLDIGCSTGVLANVLKKINTDAKITGIDISAQAGEKAKLILENFYCLDLDNVVLPDFGKKFDLIILGDVLEHLKRPDNLLSNLKLILNEDGKIIISLPNIAYITIRIKLLLGTFEYEDTGIMDRTHLRFFTQKTVKNLIVSSGYKIDKEIFILNRKLNFFPDNKPNGLLSIFYRLFSIQFVYKISKNDF
jgi:2-polyprenyl-3-methyl-5-hydroxy-6-metoxy-1,4-benzoquinol methylase